MKRIVLNGGDPLMTPGEVAETFRVDPYTVVRWANAGKLGPEIRTPGGHRRFKKSVVEAFLNGGSW